MEDADRSQSTSINSSLAARRWCRLVNKKAVRDRLPSGASLLNVVDDYQALATVSRADAFGGGERTLLTLTGQRRGNRFDSAATGDRA
jgi:hypothetical protein